MSADHHPKAMQVMNMIEEFIQARGEATTEQIIVSLRKSRTTVQHYLRLLWKDGRIKHKVRPNAHVKAVFEIGRDAPVDRDISSISYVVVTTWEPCHRRGLLECLWFGVPAQMVRKEPSCG